MRRSGLRLQTAQGGRGGAALRQQGRPCRPAARAASAPLRRISARLSGEYHALCGVQYLYGEGQWWRWWRRWRWWVEEAQEVAGAGGGLPGRGRVRTHARARAREGGGSGGGEQAAYRFTAPASGPSSLWKGSLQCTSSAAAATRPARSAAASCPDAGLDRVSGRGAVDNLGWPSPGHRSSASPRGFEPPQIEAPPPRR